MDGILVIDKPAGPSSHDVVERIRRLAPGTRVGHTGTLDPLATGVLPLCLGRATRLASFLLGSDKVYRAWVRLGITTDSFDSAGTILQRQPVPAYSSAELDGAVAKFIGSLWQMAPMFSAKKVGGRPLYRLARQGKQVERDRKLITIHEIENRGLDKDCLELVVRCSAGTYIRALANDLGRELGCGASLAQLQRLRSGGFDLASAISLEELTVETIAARLVPMSESLPDLPQLVVESAEWQRLRHGMDLILDAAQAASRSPFVRLCNADGQLLAIGKRVVYDEKVWVHPEIVLSDEP